MLSETLCYLMLIILLILLFGGADSDGHTSFSAESRQIRHERCYFETHLLAFGDDAYWLALDQVELVKPRVQLHASADRQCREHVGILLGIRRSQVGNHANSIAEVRADQVRYFLLAGLQRRE